MADQVSIGAIKWFDPASGRGVITPQAALPQRSGGSDLYFVAPHLKVGTLKVGQLVQFVVNQDASGPEAWDVAVLSDRA